MSWHCDSNYRYRWRTTSTGGRYNPWLARFLQAGNASLLNLQNKRGMTLLQQAKTHQKREIWRSHIDVVEYSSLLEYDDVSAGMELQTFRRILVCSYSELSDRRILDLDCCTLRKEALRSFKASVTVHRSAERTVAEVTMGQTARVCLDDSGHYSTAAWYVTKGNVLWTVHRDIFAY